MRIYFKDVPRGWHAPTEIYQTDEFGLSTLSVGSITQPFGYTGEPRDTETGLSQLRARMYDPAIGRFFSKDPAAGSTRNPSTLNPYSYVGNNPANRVDPSGRFWFLAGAAVGAVAGGGLYAATHWDQIQQGKANWVEAAAYVGTGAILGTGVGAVADMACVGYVGLGLLPAAVTQLQRLPSSGTINPNLVRFSQDTISYHFKNSTQTIDDMAQALRAGTLNPIDVAPIRLVERAGQVFTLDNRRLEAFRRAGVEIQYRAATLQEIAEEGYKFTSRNGGVSAEILYGP